MFVIFLITTDTTSALNKLVRFLGLKLWGPLFLLQLSGNGLIPWTVPKQTLFLLALQQASRIRNEPRTSFGFCNISSDPLSFADILAAAGKGTTPIPSIPPAPATAPAGRRRLPVSVSAATAAVTKGINKIPRISINPRAPGGWSRSLKSSLPSVGLRVLDRRSLGFLPRFRVLSEEPRDTVEVYVRLTTDFLDVSGTEFWDLLTGPLPNNSSKFQKCKFQECKSQIYLKHLRFEIVTLNPDF